jgi:hypothetical protein
MLFSSTTTNFQILGATSIAKYIHQKLADEIFLLNVAA